MWLDEPFVRAKLGAARMKLETFTGRFVRELHGDPNDEWPAFTLILGAGASRSAGIPLAGEMVSLLRLTAARATRGEHHASPGDAFRLARPDRPRRDHQFRRSHPRRLLASPLSVGAQGAAHHL